MDETRSVIKSRGDIMSEALFNILFKGKFDRAMERDKAILHFSKLFKLPIEKATLFFDGKERALKKAITLEKAGSFRTSLKKAGLRVSLVKIITENDEQGKFTLAELGVIIINKPFVQPQKIEIPEFLLDDVGVEIVEPKFIEKLDYNLHDYSINEVGITLVEKIKTPQANIDTSNISVDEVGAIFAEKPTIEEPDLDTSSISIEEVGATFAEKKKISEPDINIDAIKIVQ